MIFNFFWRLTSRKFICHMHITLSLPFQWKPNGFCVHRVKKIGSLATYNLSLWQFYLKDHFLNKLILDSWQIVKNAIFGAYLTMKYSDIYVTRIMLGLRPCPHVYGYFRIRNFFVADSKISPSTRSVFKSYSPVHTYPIVSGFTLVPKAPLH